MDNKEIIDLWKSYDKKLAENLLVNKENTEAITRMKVKSLLISMKPIKIVTLIVGILWVGCGAFIITYLFVYAYAEMSKFFLFSAAIQLLLTAIAVGVYIYQLVLINRVDISEPVLKTQDTLVKLKVSTLWITRILFLQFPLWSTFYLSEHLFATSGILFYSIQTILTGSFTYLALWLFFNIRYENKDKKWFRLIFRGKEWDPILKSITLSEEIGKFKEEVG